MIATHRFLICTAALAISGLAMGCRAMPLASEAPVLAATGPRGGLPRHGVWITYSASGVTGLTTPSGDGTEVVSAGHLRWPIFSVRLGATAQDGTAEADLLTPAGFHRHDIRAGDVYKEEISGDPYSDANLRGRGLERALMHHRPIVRLRIDPGGQLHAEDSAELRDHRACARRLLRAAVEAKLAAAENEEQRQDQREQLQAEDLARRITPPADSARLLLRLAGLPLTGFAGTEDPGSVDRDGGSDSDSGQSAWRAKQITSHGRAVRSEINLLSASDSPAARLCRSLAYKSTAMSRSDTCIIEGVIDRRDGWPIRVTVSRRGEASNGATEGQYRSFDRLLPLLGFATPPNPCSAGQ